MNLPLVFSNIASVLISSGLTYYFTVHYLAVREVDGHAVLEFHNPHDDGSTGDPMRDKPKPRRTPNWLGVFALVVGVVLIVAGLQLKHDRTESAQRDRDDRQYATCLTRFATDLVTTIKKRNEANAKIEAAKTSREAAAELRSDAVDNVVAVVARAIAHPKANNLPAYQRALADAVHARAHLDHVRQKSADAIDAANMEKENNQYVLPKAVCTR